MLPSQEPGWAAGLLAAAAAQSGAHGSDYGAGGAGLCTQGPTWSGPRLCTPVARQGVQLLPSASTIAPSPPSDVATTGSISPKGPASRAPSRASTSRFRGEWQMDFQGGWPCGLGRCHPLTIRDVHPCDAASLSPGPNRRTATVPAHLHAAFPRYGSPDRVLIDGGNPWGTIGRTPAARSRSGRCVWAPQRATARRSAPRRCSGNQRVHGTLERDVGRQTRRPGLAAWHARVDAWRHRYRHVRQHESLALAVRATRRRVSLRPNLAELPPLPCAPTAVDGCWTVHSMTVHLTTIVLRKLYLNV